VKAAVELHGTIGPAQTTVSQVAERAGVQRHTFYAHFPDERSLLMACSGLSFERDPLPDVEAWAQLPARGERLRQGLEQLYGWYERNSQLTACVLRDAEHHAPTREVTELRMGPTFARASQVLGEDLSAPQRDLLAVALDFACWRKLAQARPPAAAADLMSRAILKL